jgi:hypothetical protein
MSVITCYQEPGGSRNFDIYAKGAPEMIRSLSDPRTSNVNLRTHLTFNRTITRIAIVLSFSLIVYKCHEIAWSRSIAALTGERLYTRVKLNLGSVQSMAVRLLRSLPSPSLSNSFPP